MGTLAGGDRDGGGEGRGSYLTHQNFYDAIPGNE